MAALYRVVVWYVDASAQLLCPRMGACMACQVVGCKSAVAGSLLQLAAAHCSVMLVWSSMHVVFVLCDDPTGR